MHLLFAADIQAKARGTAAPHLVSAFSKQIGSTLDFLTRAHGIEFELLDSFLYPGHSVHRMHTVAEKMGAALISKLHNAASVAGATLVCNSHVTQLWVHEGSDELSG